MSAKEKSKFVSLITPEELRGHAKLSIIRDYQDMLMPLLQAASTIEELKGALHDLHKAVADFSRAHEIDDATHNVVRVLSEVATKERFITLERLLSSNRLHSLLHGN